MTAVRTRFEAGYYAVTSTASLQKILVLNRFRQITVAYVDDFMPLFQAMRIDPEKTIPIETLINSCILHRMAEDLGLQPGLFTLGDEAILEHCKASISNDVLPDDKALLIKELKNSWQIIATHPLLKKYIQLGEDLDVDNQRDCLLAPMAGFELFVLDYFTGCIRAYVYEEIEQFELLKQWTYLLFCTLQGKGLFANRFFKMEIFLEKTNQILAETGQRQAQVQKFLQRTKQDHETFKSTWFVAITGWVKIELDDIENESDASEALMRLLENSPAVSETDLQLNDLRAQYIVADDVENPLMKSCDFTGVQIKQIRDLNRLMKETIVYAIHDYAKTNGVTLYATQVASLPMYRLAGRSVSEEEQLIQFMLGDENSKALRAFELYVIARKARNHTLRDIAEQTITRRAKEEEFWDMTRRFGLLVLTPAPFIAGSVFVPGMVVTPQFKRLGRSIRCVAPKPAVMLDDGSPIDQNARENTLQDTLDLQQRGSCIIL
ncbi:MAG: hypothetical protein AB7I18_03655 [Candidatus Berkiella sp.]